jgi:hypothetical protein
MLAILVSIVLALLLYLFIYVRTELFRITERQSNMIMHMARMHRGLLGGIANMLHPAPEPPEAAQEDDRGLPTVVEVENEEGTALVEDVKVGESA